MKIHTYKYICIYIRHGVATCSRRMNIIGLFCKRVLWKRLYSAKETYNFKEPTNRSHPILDMIHERTTEPTDKESCQLNDSDEGHICFGVGVWHNFSKVSTIVIFYHKSILNPIASWLLRICSGRVCCVQPEPNVLQCDAVCCSVLHCVAWCCGVLRCVAVCCSELRCVWVAGDHTWSSIWIPINNISSQLRCVAVCCGILRCVAVCCGVLWCVASILCWLLRNSVRLERKHQHLLCHCHRYHSRYTIYVCAHVYVYACTYIYVYMCICMYIYMYMYVYIYIHLCMHVYVCIYICICTCIYMYICVCMYVCTYVRTFVCMCVCMCIYIYACMYVCMLVCLFECMCVPRNNISCSFKSTLTNPLLRTPYTSMLAVQWGMVAIKLLQHSATNCNPLQAPATHYNALHHTATHCNTLEHTATHCNTLLNTATHCNTLQHTATQACRRHSQEWLLSVILCLQLTAWLRLESPPMISRMSSRASAARGSGMSNIWKETFVLVKEPIEETY